MATPAKATPVRGAPVTDSPGTWRHPRLDEITRRRNATTFSEKNVRQATYNVAALLILWSLSALARLNNSKQTAPSPFRIYVGWAWFALQLWPLANIIIACLPLIRKNDELSDIPLTPAQRKLLGLAPSALPPTPDAKYSTPPRYSRTPSISGSVGSRGSYNSSPLSGRGSPIVNNGASGSPFSPASSPFQQRSPSAFGDGRRSSLGTSSAAKLFSDPASPTPSGGKRASVGLNSKWLYEKGRRSSGSSFLH